jgi:hypothetical protein
MLIFGEAQCIEYHNSYLSTENSLIENKLPFPKFEKFVFLVSLVSCAFFTTFT